MGMKPTTKALEGEMIPTGWQDQSSLVPNQENGVRDGIRLGWKRKEELGNIHSSVEQR